MLNHQATVVTLELLLPVAATERAPRRGISDPRNTGGAAIARKTWASPLGLSVAWISDIADGDVARDETARAGVVAILLRQSVGREGKASFRSAAVSS